MLNKEALYLSCRKKQEPILIHCGTDSWNGRDWGYPSDDGKGSLSKIPYWTFGLGLGKFYLAFIGGDGWCMLGAGMSLKSQSGKLPTKSVTLSLTFMNMPSRWDIPRTYICSLSPDNSSKRLTGGLGETNPALDPFGWYYGEGMADVLVTFAPPQTDICRGSRHLFNGGGVNARERSTIACAGEEIPGTTTSGGLGWCHGVSNTQRRIRCGSRRLDRALSKSRSAACASPRRLGRLREWAEERRQSVGDQYNNRVQRENLVILHHRPQQGRGDSLVASPSMGGANA